MGQKQSAMWLADHRTSPSNQCCLMFIRSWHMVDLLFVLVKLGEEKLYLRIAFEIIDLAGKMRGTSRISLWNRIFFWCFQHNLQHLRMKWLGFWDHWNDSREGQKKMVARGNMISVYIWIQNVAKGFRIRVYPPTGGWWLINLQIQAIWWSPDQWLNPKTVDETFMLNGKSPW